VKGLELFTTKNTKYSQKRFNEAEKISSILGGKIEEDKILNENAVVTEEIERDQMFANSHNRKGREKRKTMLERAQFGKENDSLLIGHFLYNVVSEALLLDPEIKAHNKAYMEQQISAVTGHLVQEGHFETPESATMRAVLEAMEYHIDQMFQSKADESAVKSVRESYIENIGTYVGYVAEAVKEKVAGVVAFEKDTAAVISESEEEVSLSDTLFKTIQMENVKMALKEEEASEITEVVLERAMAETIFDYTLLETLNTLKIISVDGQQLRSGMSRFFNK
jgi:hypothetical protein